MPRTRTARTTLLLLLLLGISACSTQKDAFLNRTFHRLVSRDNGWFNANEKLKETVAAMEKNHKDDFDAVLPIFVYGTEDQAKAMVPELEKCIEKCAVIVDRHSMEIGGEEKNTWVDDAYYVLGRCHFYKRSYFDAERTFDFTSRRYKGSNRQYDAKLWQARAAIQLEQYSKAQSLMDELRNLKQTPKNFRHDELSAVQADLDLKRGKVDDGIVNLERAVQIAERRKDKVRWSFILAQLYQMKGQEDRAIEQYGRVARMNAPYEIGFHAQIFQALALDRGNSKAIRQKLHRMLRDDKHRDHFDMIHYALAELDLKENNDSSAIAELRTSARVSTVDLRQKAKSFLKLADLYFDDRQYEDAQHYYDSTATLIPEVHPRREEITTRAEVLGDLVEQLRIIAREDSLQAFAQLDEEEQERRVRHLIREREAQEAEREAQEALARELPPAVNTPKPAGGGGDAGAWYFYNQMQLGRGATEFKKKWGNRPNEDNWRRKDKSGSAVLDLTEGDPETEPDKPTASKDGEDPEWKKPENYLKDLPKDSADLAASDARICEALYISGMIYKEKLKDVDNAIESFEVLNNRFDDCRYTPESHYQMYRIYLEKERSGTFMDFGGASSEAYANIIQERWPDSEFARLVRNPDLLQADEARHQAEVAAYEQLYQLFRDGHYIPVITGAEKVITTEPDNHLLAKYHLLKAMAVGGMREMTAFRNALNAVVSGFAGTDEAKAAATILANLDRQGAPGQPAPPRRATANYTPDAGQHYVVLLFPNSAGRVDQATAKISDFNQTNFRNSPFEIKTFVFDTDNQVIMVRMFDTKDKAMAYFDLFRSDRNKLTGVNDRDFPMFAISAGNYQQFFTTKDLDTYVSFFGENYLKAK